MANTKKKNNIKITSVKRNNKVLKNGVKTTITNNKPNSSNKKEEVAELEKKEKVVVNSPVVKNKKPKNNQAKKYNTTKKKTNKPKQVKIVDNKKEQVSTNVEKQEQVSTNIEKKEQVLTPEEIIAKRKERNRRKYENKQKKYREKKQLVVEEKVEEVKEEQTVVQEEFSISDLDSEELIKKSDISKENKSEAKEKELERKEKRKTNRKTSGFTQTITNIKEVSVSKINDVREKVDDNTIPIGKTFNEKSLRSKRLIKEAIVYSIILTVIDVICIIVFDYFNFLRLFDVKSMNVMLTIIIALVFNFFVAFMVDYFVTNVWLTKKRKGKDGEQNGDNRSFKEKHRKNIKDKKRK